MIRPLLLKGHERPISDVKYNRDGDMLFISSKDSTVSVWWTDNGERIGTYEGHNGAIFSIDVNQQSTRLLSASADNTVKLWDVENGQQLYTFPHQTGVRVTSLAQGDENFFTITDAIMGFTPIIRIFKLAEDSRDQKQHDEALLESKTTSQVLSAIWGYHNETIITGHQDGNVRILNVETGKEIDVIQAHRKEIISVRLSWDRTCFITASKDGTSKLFDTRSQDEIKLYETGRPINAAHVSPLMDHIIVGGGERAEDVTLTAMTTDQFKVRFYHSIFGEELGSIPGHFGPVNVLTFSPDGRSFASGSEDGFVRLHYFPEDYFDRLDEVSVFDSPSSSESVTKD